jgi:hypothetical protein
LYICDCRELIERVSRPPRRGSVIRMGRNANLDSVQYRDETTSGRFAPHSCDLSLPVTGVQSRESQMPI